MRAVIFANGHIEDLEHAHSLLRPGDFIIAADGGGLHCATMGIRPDALVGDMDSLPEALVVLFESGGSQVQRFSSDKDETDLELALLFALQRGAESLLLLGLLGGRWDMTLANLLLLAQPRFAGIPVQVVDGLDALYLLRGGETLALSGHPGDRVSVLPLNSQVNGLTYRGLAYPLQNAALPFGSPRGVSNTLLGSQAEISLTHGLVLCIHSRQK